MGREPYRGFTLVELSIVLVIIGLLVSAVLGGKALINAAEVRSIISDVNGYMTAIRTFQMQYSELPGDMPNASEYWTSCTDSGGNTCNGDGNSRIDLSLKHESYRMWQHLNLANIVPGGYDPTASASGVAIVGSNVPKLANGGGVCVSQWDIFVGGESLTSNWSCVPRGTLSPSNAYIIDLKMDDGRAQDGKVWGVTGISAPHFCSDILGTPNNYLVNETGKACRLIFEDVLDTETRF